MRPRLVVSNARRRAGGVAGRQTVLMFWRPKNVTATALGGLRQKLVGYRGTGAMVGPGETATLGFRVVQ